MRKRTKTAEPVAGAASRLRLESRLGFQDAAALAASVQAQRGAGMEIDASEVVEIGTPCLQVLLSAAASWRSDGRSLAIVEPSPAVLAALGHLGLELDAFRAEGAAA